MSQSIAVKGAQLAKDVALLCKALAFAVTKFAEEAGDFYPSRAACLQSRRWGVRRPRV